MNINDDILISYLLGEATARQVAEMEDWQKKSDENAHRLKQFQLIWQASEELNLQTPMDASESLKRFKQKTLERTTEQPKIIPIRLPGVWLKIAAMLLITIGVSWFFLRHQNRGQLLLSTVKLEVKADTLSDGSVVTLNQNTAFKYPRGFNKEKREVWLDRGEAFFSVIHRTSQPFIVNAGKIRIQVLGTSFNVKNKSGSVEVIVETGLVAVTDGRQKLFLHPNEKLSIVPENKKFVLSQSTNKFYNYYHTREFVADGTPLPQLVNALNEAYDCHIVIKNTKLDSLKLNTTFRNESLEDILDVIGRTFKIKVIKTNEAILLK